VQIPLINKTLLLPTASSGTEDAVKGKTLVTVLFISGICTLLLSHYDLVPHHIA
jgi:hypothetical protein